MKLKIDLVKCGHCGVMPTKADAELALSRWQWRDKPCAICGKTMRPNRVKLVHGLVGAKADWHIQLGVFTGILKLEMIGRGSLVMHDRCARKTMPHTNWKALDDPKEAEARIRSVWTANARHGP